MEGDATLLCCGHDLIGVEAELEKLIVGTFHYSSDILFRYSLTTVAIYCLDTVAILMVFA